MLKQLRVTLAALFAVNVPQRRLILSELEYWVTVEDVARDRPSFRAKGHHAGGASVSGFGGRRVTTIAG